MSCKDILKIIDAAVNCIEDQFKQVAYQALRNIEQLLLNVFAFSQLNYESQLSDIAGVYSDEVHHYRLSTRLQTLGTKFIKSDEKIIPGIINYMKQCSGAERELNSEITVLLRLYLVSSATNAVIERSA